MAQLGLYLGSAFDDVTNIQNVLVSWVRFLCEAGHSIDLIGGQNKPSLPKDVSKFDVSDTTARTPFGKIKLSYCHISQYINNNNPDGLVQIWKYQTHAPAVTLAGKAKELPTVVRVAGDIFQEFRGYTLPKSAGVFILDNLIGRIPLRLASKLVTLGPNLKKSVVSRRGSTSDVHIIPPPAPDKEQFTANSSTNADSLLPANDPARPTGLYVGRLTRQKGLNFLEKVIKQALHETEFQFVIVGEGPYRDIFRNRFSRNDVILPGYVPHAQIGQYYKSATAYLHPSRFEGLPLVILEALQSGTPVIAREAGDVSFVIENTVKTWQEMFTALSEKDWNTEWKNQRFFSEEYQRSSIAEVVGDALMM